jgi:hypothetical protein
MSVLVIQAVEDPYFDSMLKLTQPNTIKGCEQYGYQYYAYAGRPVLSKETDHPYWLLPSILKTYWEDIKGFRQIVWLDADTYWDITEPLEVTIPIKDSGLGKSFMETPMFGATRHRGHYNIGCLWIFNAPIMANFIDAWLATPDEDHPQKSQAVFNKLIGHHPKMLYELDHKYNHVLGELEYQTKDKPIVYAWHGQPNRIEAMREFIFNFE